MKQETVAWITTDPELNASNPNTPSGPRFRQAAPFILAIILLALTACGRATPPGPNAIGASADGQTSYLLLDWQEGLRILIWDDIPYGGHYSSGTSSTTDPLFRQEGSIHGADGRGYAYTLETGDGIEADFAIDGIPYDLSRGKAFLVRVAGEKKQVQQLDLDLSGLSPTNEGILAFGRQTAEIAALMTGPVVVETPEATATPTPSAAETPKATAPPVPSAAAPAIGVPELDRLAAVILENDLEARRELVRYTTAGCTNADGLGGPPKCQPDQVEGAPVDYLPLLGPGEGATVLPEAVGEMLDFPAETLYAAYRRADEPIRDIYYPPGDFGLFFTTGEGERNIQFVLVHADNEGRIVRLDYLACPVAEDGQIIVSDALVCSPEQIIERESGELLLAP